MSKSPKFYWGFNIIGWIVILIFLAWLFVGCNSEEGSAFAWGSGLRHPEIDYGTCLTPDPLIVQEYTVPRSGRYLVLYHAQVVNNHADPLNNVKFAAQLLINGEYEISFAFNVTWGMHYGVIPLHWEGILLEGDLLEITMEAASSQGILPCGACMREGRETLSVLFLGE